MAEKFFTWPKLLIIIAAIVIIIVGVVWYASYNVPSTSSAPTPTPIITSSPTQIPTSKPSPTASNSSTQTPNPTPSPTSTNSPTPAITTTPAPTPQSTPSPTPTPAPSPSPSPTPPPPTTAVFNFDNATTTLTVRQPTPFDQTSNGVTAHFSSPTDFPSRPSFSVQDLNSLAAISTVVNSAKFSGLFLWPSTISRDRLGITFSQNMTSISFVFKTAELHDPGPGGTGSPIRLTAYINSLSTPVGSPVIVNGVETAFDTYPEGTLIFNSNGQPFNMVEIDLPYISAEGATGFIIDNVIVITK